MISAVVLLLLWGPEVTGHSPAMFEWPADGSTNTTVTLGNSSWLRADGTLTWSAPDSPAARFVVLAGLVKPVEAKAILAALDGAVLDSDPDTVAALCAAVLCAAVAPALCAAVLCAAVVTGLCAAAVATVALCAAVDVVLCAAAAVVLCAAVDVVLCATVDVVLCAAISVVLCAAVVFVLCAAVYVVLFAAFVAVSCAGLCAAVLHAADNDLCAAGLSPVENACYCCYTTMLYVSFLSTPCFAQSESSSAKQLNTRCRVLRCCCE